MPTIPAALFRFLTDLAEHNDREWFNANKKRYERDVRDPALAFIDAFQGPLADLSPHFLAEPKAQGGSLFRIHRDTRFSADKTPYKTHTAMQFRHRDASRDVHAPGFYLHLEPGASGVGVGIWMPPTPVLNTLRGTIVAQSERWSALKAGFAEAGLSFMDGEHDLKRVPRGFDANHPHADDLRRKSLAVHRSLTDAEVTAPDFQGHLAAAFSDGAPLVELLCEAVGLPY
ncbi:MAG: DUF2461 domain-containing protein [Myxococcota bacterium]